MTQNWGIEDAFVDSKVSWSEGSDLGSYSLDYNRSLSPRILATPGRGGSWRSSLKGSAASETALLLASNPPNTTVERIKNHDETS